MAFLFCSRCRYKKCRNRISAMELPISGSISRIASLCLLTTFVYIAFVSSGAYAAPYQTSGTYASPYQTADEVGEELAVMYDRDIQEMCANSEISVATRVLCRLADLRTQEPETEVPPLRSWRSQRVQKRGKITFKKKCFFFLQKISLFSCFTTGNTGSHIICLLGPQKANSPLPPKINLSQIITSIKHGRSL